MKKLFSLVTAMAFIASLAAGPVANATGSHQLKEESRHQKIGQVESYLNQLQTFAADFEQSVNGVAPSSGKFFLKKPGRFLWHYQKPEPSKLVSSGGTIYFHDETTNQTTQIPRKGMAKLLTQKEFNLTKGNLRVRDIYQKGGLLHVVLTFKGLKEGDVGAQVKLTFLETPLQLRQITTINQLGQEVEVFLYNIQENAAVPNRVFSFVPFHYQEN